MTTYCYIRVSSADQNVERQQIAFDKLGIDMKTYIDKQSGKDFDRPEYKKMLRKLKTGDVLYIKSLDRLGRNYEEMQDQWRILTKTKGVDMVVLDMPLLDTRKEKTLVGTLIADLVLQILCFVAENEREAIRTRQAEGIAAAKARGVHFGRKKMELPDGFDEVCKEYLAGRISTREGATKLSMSPSTFHRRCVEKSTK